jgi:signal transduction histidine kinase
MLLLTKVDNCQAQTLDLSDINTNHYYNIVGTTMFSTKDRISIDSILKLSDSFSTKQANKRWIRLGSSINYHWIRFELNNNGSDDLTFKLVVGNHLLSEIELFRVDSSDAVSLGRTGRLFPFAQRPYNFNHYTYPLQLAAGGNSTFYLFIDSRGMNYQLMLLAFSDSYFAHAELRLSITYGIFIGILLLATFFNFFLYFHNREKIHFVYGLYALSVILTLLALEGLDFQYLYPNIPRYTKTGLSTYTCFSTMLMLWVMQLFLKQDPSNSYFYRLVNIHRKVLFALPFCGFWVVHFSSNIYLIKLYFYVYPVSLLIGLALVVASCVEKVIQGYKLAYYYLFAVSLVVIGASSMILGILGTNYKSRNLPPNLIEISLVLESLVICFGILYRYILIRREKERLEIDLQVQKLSLTQQIISIQETERKRIAEDLHDELGSSLAALKLRLQNSNLEGDELNGLLSIVDKASDDTRLISHNLMPPEFEKTDFQTLLTNYYARLNTESHIHFHFYHSGGCYSFNKSDELILYRIIMELTSNILRHAEATEATLQLIYYENYLEIMIEDNGKGINNDPTDGIGIKNVQSRVSYLKGELKIDSGKLGTTFMIQIPYKNL